MPKDYPRAARLSAQLQQELSSLLRGDLLRDPRVYGIDLTVAAVELAQDLSHAHVLVSSLRETADLEEAIKGLNHAAGKLRGELGKRLRLRYVPELTFKADAAGREADRINRLLREALNQDRQSAASRGDKGE